MKISISLPDELVAMIDEHRGDVPRSVYMRRRLEDGAPVPGERVTLRVTPEPERSPEPEPEFEEPRVDKWGNPVGTTYDEDDPRGWT